MRIGIDCDGVLRDFIPALIESIKETHPEHSNKILVPRSWDWEQWLPFWTEDETEKYVFQDNYIDLFGIECPPIQSSVEDWPKLKAWAKEHGHELILVSAQRDHCKELTDEWLKHHGFDFDEVHYTHHKWTIDVDVLIDDSSSKLNKFKEKSINNGNPICYRQTWNTECQKSMITIDRLSGLIGKLFG
jgi:5'(3')-deoxyribonucleotidase